MLSSPLCGIFMMEIEIVSHKERMGGMRNIYELLEEYFERRIITFRYYRGFQNITNTLKDIYKI